MRKVEVKMKFGDLKIRKDVGSIFPITSREVKSDVGVMPFDNEPNIHYFSLCREAIFTVIESFKRQRGRVLLPAYTCQTVITPFLELGWDCYYYDITPDLRINVDGLYAQACEITPDILLVHPYYGRDLNARELDVLKTIKRNCHCRLIMDLTQCLFSTCRDEVFDYYVGSMRKWFPVPDGAFLFSPHHEILPNTKLTENDGYVSLELDAMLLMGLYYDTGYQTIKDVSRRLDKLAVSKVKHGIVPHVMSAYSRGVISEADIPFIQRCRRDNYLYLLDNVVERVIHPIGREIGELSTAPLYFPVYAENREVLIQQLISQRVYAPILWEGVDAKSSASKSVCAIYEHILAIPCDQRYGEADLQRVVEVLNGDFK